MQGSLKITLLATRLCMSGFPHRLLVSSDTSFIFLQSLRGLGLYSLTACSYCIPMLSQRSLLSHSVLLLYSSTGVPRSLYSRSCMFPRARALSTLTLRMRLPCSHWLPATQCTTLNNPTQGVSSKCMSGGGSTLWESCSVTCHSCV